MTLASPSPQTSSAFSFRKKWVWIFLLVLAGIFLGLAIYLRWKKSRALPTCERILAPDHPGVKTFLLSDSTAGELLGEHSALACPEAGKAYFEWYFLILHTDRHYLEAALWLKGQDLKEGIAGFNIKDAVSLKPILVAFEPGENPSFAKSGCEVRMRTRGPEGEKGESFLRLLKEGPRAGWFELRVFSRQGELHLFLKPETPGMISEGLASDRTRPGSWFQFSAPVMMGAVEGEFREHRSSAPALSHPFPGPETKTAHAYLEHMWGQADADRFYWDWGEFEDPLSKTALIYSQAERPSGEIASFLVLARGFEVPLNLILKPPVERVRVVYARFFQEGHALYPQQTMIWGYSREPSLAVNLEGFLLDHDHDYLVFNLWGQYQGKGGMSGSWSPTNPVRSVAQFFKGALAEDYFPAPPRDFRADCDGGGCRLSWRHPPCSEGEVEYWLFRRSAREETKGLPFSAVPGPCSGATTELSYHDPRGRSEDIYTLVPVCVPPTLLHQRLRAGYPISWRANQSPVREKQPIPPSLAQALREGDQKNFPGPEKTIVMLGSGEGQRRVRLVKAPPRGYQFLLEKKSGQEWRREAVLPVKFGPGVQVQSFDAKEAGELVLAWSERSPIKGGRGYSNWQVFRAGVNLATGVYYISPISQSELEAVAVEMFVEPSQELRVRYLECDEQGCVQRGEE